MLDGRLADAVDLATQAKQAHWNAKGPSPIGLHRLYDDVAGSVNAYLDLPAERIVQVGATAVGTAGVAAARSSLPGYPLDITSGRDPSEALALGLAAFGEGVRQAIDQAEGMGTKAPPTSSPRCPEASTPGCGWWRPTFKPRRRTRSGRNRKALARWPGGRVRKCSGRLDPRRCERPGAKAPGLSLPWPPPQGRRPTITCR